LGAKEANKLHKESIGHSHSGHIVSVKPPKATVAWVKKNENFAKILLKTTK